MINRLSAVDCPNCGLELLSTNPYPAKVSHEIEVTCGGCGGVGRRTMPPEWQYTDTNAYPMEQVTNRRIVHTPPKAEGGNEGQLIWD